MLSGDFKKGFLKFDPRTSISNDYFYEYVDEDVDMDPHYINHTVMWQKHRLEETENESQKKVRLDSTVGEPVIPSTGTSSKMSRKKRSRRARPKAFFKKRRRNSYIDDEAEEVPDEVVKAEDDTIKPKLVGSAYYAAMTDCCDEEDKKDYERKDPTCNPDRTGEWVQNEASNDAVTGFQSLVDREEDDG